jgi:A/G-specific adenine glycosylase
MVFSKTLLDWYQANKRELPWRNTREPYLIWLSEIMLQQTRVAQGLPYFMAFTEAFPTVFDLANADEQEVLKLWQGLGYYSRARNLHQTAKYIANELEGQFPTTYNDLLKLKGVGEYTAAAIASFSYDEAVPVVDGNVYRVLSRYFGLETDISSSGAKKEFTSLAKSVMPNDKAALFNQAIMEFGALQCVPKNPDCESCVFNGSCAALQQHKIDLLPIKTKKTKVSNRYFNYLVFLDSNEQTIIRKRTEKGIWQHLYEFPLIESNKELSYEELLGEITLHFPHKTIENISYFNEDQIIHKLSHQKLHIRFYRIALSKKILNGISLETLKNYPFPVVIFNFINNYSI